IGRRAPHPCAGRLGRATAKAPQPAEIRRRCSPDGAKRNPGTAFPLRRFLMLDAAIKALAQMASPPFRALLVKSIALAIVLIIVLGIGIDRGLVFLLERGGAWIEVHAGTGAHTPVAIFEWIVAIAAGLATLPRPLLPPPAGPPPAPRLLF